MFEKHSNIQIKIIKGAYHCPMETHVEEFNQFVLDFLSKNN